MDDLMRRIAVAFAAKADHEGCMGKIMLGRLLKELGETRYPSRLEAMGWFEGVSKTPTSNVGRYRLGEKLRGFVNGAVQEDVPPEGEYEYAQWLVVQKPALQAEKERLNLDYEERIKALETERKDKVRAIELRLGDVSVAEQALKKLASLKIRRDDPNPRESEPAPEEEERTVSQDEL